MRVALKADPEKKGTVKAEESHLALDAETGLYNVEEDRVTVVWDDGTQTNLLTSDTETIED